MRSGEWGVRSDHLAQDAEVRLVRREGEHDEVGVQPVDHVPDAGSGRTWAWGGSVHWEARSG